MLLLDRVMVMTLYGGVKLRDIGCSAMRCHNLTFTKARWIMTCPNGCFAVERHRRKSGLICRSCKQNVQFVLAQDDA